ncbi:MAG: type VI secretion system tip protein VgrG [Myxococcales bacterium]|nr:type VI secretion system tip protein VgrG [Myxococcales bacterium]
MFSAEVAFESISGLEVRSFHVHEAMSAPFEVRVILRSRDPAIDLVAPLGKGAVFALRSDKLGGALQTRVWTGVCRHIEQLSADPTGESVYLAHIVPELWLLTLREGCRIYQHKTVPQIAQALCEEWGIKPKLKLSLEHPPLEYVTQYGETDLAFLSRILERAGLSYYFEHVDDGTTTLVVCDEPAAGKASMLLPYRDKPMATDSVFATQLRLSHRVRPGRVTIRDFDFRGKVDFKLLGESPKAAAPEDKYELYSYDPGAFLIETGGPGGAPSDDQGTARHVAGHGTKLAQRALEAARRGKRLVSMRVGSVDVAPGILLAVEGYPRDDVDEGDVLLVIETWLHGADGDEWVFAAEAAFAADPFQPVWQTHKPRIRGLQSAVVVGPPGEREIYTDEFGRVRVQFHWDREGKLDDHSSCWLRVSQAWAGSGFGTMHIPRIGEEVWVAFFEGDPDLPVVVGRAHNAREIVPYALPGHQTRSTWRSDSTPKSDGYNEIRFEDARGNEHIYVQAQRNLVALVKHDETERTGKSRMVVVGENRGSTVGQSDSVLVGEKYSVQMITPPKEEELKIGGQQQPDITPLPTKLEIVHDKIAVTTGPASLTLDTKDVVLECKGSLGIKAKNVIVEGGPNVLINS